MSSVTREEFETVKELLGSAARYAESANRGVERLQMAQETSQAQISLLLQSQRMTEQKLESFISETQRLLVGQAERLSQLEAIAGRLEGILAYLTRKDDQNRN